ncbi:hypothetical protein KEJ34_04090 [Candidatus Bathyarchaeota archaeon]|nr:hypothetical protein [Candidatus Bathyarchaeota archaeon]
MEFNLNFPLSLSEISLWLAAMAIILLIASELTAPSNIIINKKRLRLAGLILGLGFMATVIIRIFHPF